nr:ATP synthase F0 subunit 6 [Xorides funiuensis]
MMNNIFSVFDSSTNSSFEMNWLSSILIFLILPWNYWLLKSRINMLINIILNFIYNEFKIILKYKFNYNNMFYFISMMLFILINNFMGLFPYIFTSSSHLIFSISLALPLWISLMLMGWLNNINHMFSHMIPQSTPFILMPFMVMIETTSNLIRPLTLTIRLTANMIAGHLLITLLSQSAISPLLIISIMIILIQITLMILEFSVSIIQAYVFTILSILYTKEIY